MRSTLLANTQNLLFFHRTWFPCHPKKPHTTHNGVWKVSLAYSNREGENQKHKSKKHATNMKPRPAPRPPKKNCLCECLYNISQMKIRTMWSNSDKYGHMDKHHGNLLCTHDSPLHSFTFIYKFPNRLTGHFGWLRNHINNNYKKLKEHSYFCINKIAHFNTVSHPCNNAQLL